MQQTSKRFKEILAQPHRVEARLRIAGRNYPANTLVSLSMESDVFSNECPSVGNATSGYITVEMLTPESAFPMMSKMELFCRVVAQADGSVSEWIPKGVFWLDSRKSDLTDSGLRPTVTLTGYDAILKTEMEYTPDGTWPKTDKEVLDSICTRLSIPCDEQLGHHYPIPRPDDYTCRELLGYIAAAYGGNWIIDEGGKLVLFRLGASGERFPLVAQRVTAGGSLSPITQVAVHKMDGNMFTAGSPGRTLNVDCPWASQSMANSILSQIEGFCYAPFEAGIASIPPTAQLGDECAGMGIVYSIHADFLGGIIADISAPPEEEIAHNYPYPSRSGGGAGGMASRALNSARKKTEEIKSLVADVGAAKAGIKASVKYVDLEDATWVNAHTSIFADGAGKRSALDLWVEGTTNGEITSFAKLVADQIELKSAVGDAEASLKLKAEKTEVEDIDGRLETVESATSELKTSVGKAESGLKQATTKINDMEESNARVYAQIQDDLSGCVREAYLELYAVSDGNGHSRTIAQLVADTIKLLGRVDLTGSLTVEGGFIKVASGAGIWIQNGIISVGGSGMSSILHLSANDIYTKGLKIGADGLQINGSPYTPIKITSTSGAVFQVLGC